MSKTKKVFKNGVKGAVERLCWASHNRSVATHPSSPTLWLKLGLVRWKAGPTKDINQSCGVADVERKTWWGESMSSQQIDWRWCKKCQGLFFSLNPTSGYCPTGGGHDYTGSVDYQHIPSGFNLQGTQRGWQWCNKCQGTFFDGNNTSGHCPTGGGHDYAGSIGYQLQIN